MPKARILLSAIFSLAIAWSTCAGAEKTALPSSTAEIQPPKTDRDSRDKTTLNAKPTRAIPTDIRREDYPVAGDTLREAVASMKKKHKNGHHASTEWKVRWRFRYRQEGDECRLSGFYVRPQITINLPKWKIPADASKATKREWQRYSDALILHELGHADHARKAAKQIQQTVEDADWVAADEDKLRSKLTEHCQTIIDTIRKEEATYDEKTGHGRTQGASLHIYR